jgi:hypothetical protein|tara:strand:+ start:69 stop:773 length:705 start_codon:yes stop_codon:yes gene_type:complete
MKQLNKAILYEGPSLIDGQPIVAIATYSDKNTKTGLMVQTYILCQNIDPRDANKTGADFSICGTCPLKGIPTLDPKRKLAEKRKCYVRIDQGSLIVWKAYQKGRYQKTNNISELGRGRMVRLGTYGDPAAVPSYVWEQLLEDAIGHTAYSHQNDIIPIDKKIFMGSADSLEHAKKFWNDNIRTFRVIQNLNEIQDNEILCPASKEAGRKSTCAKCKLCSGTSSNSKKSIAIVQH